MNLTFTESDNIIFLLLSGQKTGGQDKLIIA